MEHELVKKNVPVRFYGKVIDQNSNGLAGVTIKVSIRHWGMTMSTFSSTIHIELVTDANGFFFIHGAKGDAFDFDVFQKNSYELEPTTRLSFGAQGGTPADPVLFTMWLANIHEQLIAKHVSFHVLTDGRPYFIDLTKGTISESGQGELRVWIKRPEHIAPKEKYLWSAGIEPINGGLLEETNEGCAMFRAPESGYLPNFHIDQQIVGNQRASTGTRRFYIRLEDVHEFGRIAIQLFAPYRDNIPGLISLDYALNPSGSRILR